MSVNRLTAPRSYVFCCVLFLLSGCDTSEVAEVTEQTPASTTIHVEPVSAQTWSVTIELEQPTKRLIFLRTPSEPVRSGWRLADVRQKLEQEGKRDLITAEAPFSKVELIVASDDRFIRGDYSLTQTFDNEQGSVLYLGHFVAAPEGQCADLRDALPPCPAELSVNYVITPKPNEMVWLDGVVHREPFSWQPENTSGGFAYFGNAKPDRHADWNMLIDPNVAAWMREDLVEYLPKLTSLYAQWFGKKLTLDPQLMFSFRGGNDISASGGVIDNMVQFTLSGDVWESESAANRVRYFHLVAHETAHFWNASMFEHDHSTGESWLHEGNADAMAFKATIELGLRTSDELWAARTVSLNQCRSATQIPLNDAGKRGRFDLYYPCGQMMELIVEGLLRQQGLGASAHWKHMLAKLEGPYSGDKYFDAVLELTNAKQEVEQLRRWVNQGWASPTEFDDLLQRVGVRVQGPVSAQVNDVVRSMLQHIQQQDCGGSFSLTVRDQEYKLLPLPRCKSTPRNGLNVTQVLGFELSTDMISAYNALRVACWDQSEVTVAGRSGGEPTSFAFQCKSPFEYVEQIGWSTIAL